MEDFELFWLEYPRKISKKLARKVWERIKPSVELKEKIMCALAMQKAYWEKEETEQRFIPHASTWLNQERWEDVVVIEKTWQEKFLESTKGTIQ